MRQGTTNVLNNGIDPLIYCLEGAVDPSVTGSATYFPTRSPDPTARTTPYGTDAAAIRRLWRWNLYRRTQL